MTQYIQDIIKRENEARLAIYGVPLSLEERVSIRGYVESLISKAKPGNRAWHKLNTRFGLDGDVSMDDFGERERVE
jgi:hypothetical protein